MDIINSSDKDVDPIVKRHNQVWIFQYKPVGGPLVQYELYVPFNLAVERALQLAEWNKGIMVTVKFPKHIDDDPRDYSSFYVIVRG